MKGYEPSVKFRIALTLRKAVKSVNELRTCCVTSSAASVPRSSPDLSSDVLRSNTRSNDCKLPAIVSRPMMASLSFPAS